MIRQVRRPGISLGGYFKLHFDISLRSNDGAMRFQLLKAIEAGL